METSPVSITIANRQGEIVFANARAEEVLGLGKSEITQLTYDAPEWRITDYAGHPFPREDLPFVQVMRTQAPVYHVRHAIEWPNGRRRLLSINGAPLLNGDGEIERIVFAIEDVTAQVKAEQERIAKLKRELRAVAKIAAYPATSIAARSFGTLPLREQSADLYQQLIETYRKLLESALEQRAYKSKRDLSSEIRALANRLGNEGARPRDVIDVHIAALRDKQAEANPRKSAAYAEEGRLIALELMGDLVTYYRTRCVGINRSDS
jgi:PAS domain S-box-containing protein